MIASRTTAPRLIPAPRPDFGLTLRDQSIELDCGPDDHDPGIEMVDGRDVDNARDRDVHGTTACGERNGAYTKPHRRPRGERNGAYTKPHRRPRGERNGAYTKPESRAKGQRNGRAKLTQDQVIEIRVTTGCGREIAKKYEATDVLVSKIKRVLLWKHI